MKVLVVCHVETGIIRNREILFDRSRPEGVTSAVPRIAEFAEQHEVPITFALTPQSLELLDTDLQGFSRGLHLHPKDPVLVREMNRKVAVASDCLRDYTSDEQSNLIKAAVESFVRAVGNRPKIFVAGNWSENADTLRIVEGEGFRFDASALPGHFSGCADWRRVPRLAQPYEPDVKDYQSRGTSALLYVPVYQGLWGDYLTPETLHLLGVEYFKAALTEAAVGGACIVHIYFHSAMALDPFFLSEFARALDFARDAVGTQFPPLESLVASPHITPRPFPPAYLAYLRSTRLKSLIARWFPALRGETPGQ